MKIGLWLALALIVVGGQRPGEGFPVESEQARVRAHLERTLADLEAHPPSGLDASQRAARTETLRWLAEYTERGGYPHNHVTAGTSPIFVDPHGTPCAVGYLLLRSGETELVEDIVRTDNRVRVAQLEGDPRLERWLDARGLTLAEAARIQPAYQEWPLGGVGEEPAPTYEIATVGVSAITAGMGTYSLFAGESARDASWTTPVTVAGLIGHTSLLVAHLITDDKPEWSPWVHGVGLLLGSVNLAWVTEPSDASSDERSVQVAPILAPDRVGLRLRW